MIKNITIIILATVLLSLIMPTANAAWEEVNDSTQAHILSLEVFDEYIYAGTSANGVILRSSDGTNWTEAVDLSIATHIRSLASFDGYLYAGTSTQGKIFRSSDGTNWVEVYDHAETNIWSLQDFDGYIYAGTAGNNGLILRSSDGTNWTQVNDTDDLYVMALGVFDGYIYAGTYMNGLILRSSDGTTWTQVDAGADYNIVSFEEFDGCFYAGTGHNGLILRSSDGTNWTEVYDSITESYVKSLKSFDGYLYAGTSSGGLILRSSDGTNWTEIFDTGEEYCMSLESFNWYLYVGTGGNGKIFRDVATVPPTIEVVSNSTIYTNNTGDFQIVWGISHVPGGLNYSSLAMTWTTYNSVTDSYKHAIRPPSNNKAAPYDLHGNILRADNRNGSLNFEDNASITEGNVWKWSGGDENCDRLNIIEVNSTYTLAYYNATYQDTTFNRMWYLNRKDMLDSTKSIVKIYGSNDQVVKKYSPLMMQGHTGEYTSRIFIDTVVVGSPSYPLEVWWANNSWDPLGTIDVEDSSYATLVTSFDSTTWLNHSYSPDAGNSYVEVSVYHNTSQEITPTNTSYLIFKCDSPSASHCYGINTTADASSTNVSFADTGVMYYDSAPPYTVQSVTPNIFSCEVNGDEWKSNFFIQDNNGNWSILSHSQDIIPGCFCPTVAGYDHFHFEGFEDFSMDCTYRGTFNVGIHVSTDPDGGVVTHNLTLHKVNGDYVGTVNNTFTNTEADNTGHIDISFDSSSYYSTTEMYTLRCVATDDESKTSTSELHINFTLSPLATTGEILDYDRLVFWGYSDIPALYSAVSDNSVISLSAGTYTFHKKIHMSQYEDTFEFDEDVKITSIDDANTPHFRWTGKCNITDASIISDKSGSPAPTTDEFRAHIFSDNHYSESDYIKNSHFSYLGKGISPFRGIYLQGLSGTLIDNNIITMNEVGIVLVECDNITFSNNTISDCVNLGVDVTSGSGNNTFTLNVLSDCDEGITIGFSDNSEISHNTVSGMITHGIKIRHSDNINILDNLIYGLSLTVGESIAVDTHTVNNITYQDNIINSAEIGFYNKYLTEGNFIDNLINDVQYGITFSTDCDNNDITGNIISCNEDWMGNPSTGLFLMHGETRAKDNTIAASNGLGVWVWRCDNNIFENNSVTIDNNSYTDFLFDNGATGHMILNLTEGFSVNVKDDNSDITIKNSDGQVFNHTSNFTTYGYSSGNFQLYVDSSDLFEVIEIFDYSCDYISTTPLTALPLESLNLARFIVGSGGIVDSVNVSGVISGQNYNILDFNLNVLYSETAVGNYVQFDDNLFVGNYLIILNDVIPPVIANVTLYNLKQTSAKVRWNVDETCNNLVYYGLDEGTVIEGTCGISAWNNGTSSPSVLLGSLISDNEYFYKVYSEDASGNNATSSVGTFTTTVSTDKMPLAIYIMMILLTFGLIGATVLLRNNEKFLDVVTSFLAVFGAFMISQLAINGKVYTVTSLLDSTDAVVSSYVIFNSLALHYFMLLTSVIMVLYTVFLVMEIVIQSYKNIITRRYDL